MALLLQIWMTRFLSTSLHPDELASVLRDWLAKLATIRALERILPG